MSLLHKNIRKIRQGIGQNYKRIQTRKEIADREKRIQERLRQDVRDKNPNNK